MTALDLKYRPAKFAEVVGNRSIVQLLLARSKNGTLAGRSMMFGGPKGCGKTTLARIVARAIACSELHEGEPCGSCSACLSITEDSSASTEEFDAATQGTVDRIRSIVDDLEYGTFDGKPRVVILDEAHRLSKSSQDALLKAVEDRRFVVILCTTEPHKIGEAIRSRVEEYPVTPPPTPEIVERMASVCKEENLEYEPEALSIIAQARGNCPRTCISDLGTLSTLGSITVEAARQHFRYGSMDSLVEALCCLDSDTKKCLALLDEVMAVEGPAWVRDSIVHAIASSMREAVGAKPTFFVPTRFFPVRGRDWANLARDLSRIDKPNASDIESCLLSSSSQVPIVGAPAPRVIPAELPRELPVAARLDAILPKPSSDAQSSGRAPYAPPPPVDAIPPKLVNAPDKPEKPALLASGNLFTTPSKPISKDAPSTPRSTPRPAPKAKIVEIDGVQFSAEETLTSLDEKIEKGPSSVIAEPPPPSAEVELEKSRIPMPEKEFARGFVQRVKQK